MTRGRSKDSPQTQALIAEYTDYSVLDYAHQRLKTYLLKISKLLGNSKSNPNELREDLKECTRIIGDMVAEMNDLAKGNRSNKYNEEDVSKMLPQLISRMEMLEESLVTLTEKLRVDPNIETNPRTQAQVEVCEERVDGLLKACQESVNLLSEWNGNIQGRLNGNTDKSLKTLNIANLDLDNVDEKFHDQHILSALLRDEYQTPQEQATVVAGDRDPYTLTLIAPEYEGQKWLDRAFSWLQQELKSQGYKDLANDLSIDIEKQKDYRYDEETGNEHRFYWYSMTIYIGAS